MSRKGFSIIELLVAVAIAAIIGTAIFVLVTNRQGNVDLRSTAELAVAALRTAQQNSVSAASSTAWGVRFDNTTTTAPRFVVFASSTYAKSAEVTEYAISKRVIFDTASVPPNTSKDVVFGIRTGTTASTSVIFRIANSEKTYVLNINSAGLVTATYATSTPSTSTAPTVSGISPFAGTNTGSVSLNSIAGTNFAAGATVKLKRVGQPDITVSGHTVASVNSITGGTFNLTGVQTGFWDVVVTNADTQVGTCADCFEVNAPGAGITVTDISPVGLPQLFDHQNVTVTGTNFVNGASVAISGSGVTVHSVSFVSQTSLVLDVSVSGAASATARNVTVTNPDLQQATCSSCFTVFAAPTITDVTPDSLARGLTVTTTVTGTNFVDGATVGFGTDVTTNLVDFVSATELAANITIDPGADVGARDVTVTNPNGGEGVSVAGFSVLQDPPNLTSVDPDSLDPGMETEVQIYGSGFVEGATVSISGGSVGISATTFYDSGHMSAYFTVDFGADETARTVTVTNPDEQSGQCVECFWVGSPPALSWIVPTVADESTYGGVAPWEPANIGGWFSNDTPPTMYQEVNGVNSFGSASTPGVIFTGIDFMFMPEGTTIDGICVHLDNAGVNLPERNVKLHVGLTWDGGTSMTSLNTAMPNFSNLEGDFTGRELYFTGTGGAPGEVEPSSLACTTWGRSWNISEVQNPGFGIVVFAVTEAGSKAQARFDVPRIAIVFGTP